MNEKFNRLMPESEGSVLCYELSKPISSEGYKNNFLNLAKDAIKNYGEVRVLLNYSSYYGWEEEAAEMDLATHLELGKYITKIALVGAPEKEIMARIIRRPLTNADMRFFSKNNLSTAISWIKS